MRRNKFKPGDLVQPRGLFHLSEHAPSLVVEVDGPVVRTLQGGVIYAWMFDELEAVHE